MNYFKINFIVKFLLTLKDKELYVYNINLITEIEK